MKRNIKGLVGIQMLKTPVAKPENQITLPNIANMRNAFKRNSELQISVEWYKKQIIGIKKRKHRAFKARAQEIRRNDSFRKETITEVKKLHRKILYTSII